ncbi:PLxRFG domain-containing protein [Pseudoalteromonas galatheae]|uniref:PLxRFG domain-containing protein n=1 Tax=Pseudoalteromonas galatheae TaxID=579562 RepID=UPI0030CF181D
MNKYKSLSELDNNQGIIADTVDAGQKGMYDGLAGIAETLGMDETKAWAKEQSQEQVQQMSLSGREALAKPFFEKNEFGDVQTADAITDPRSYSMNIAHMFGANADVLLGAGTVKVGTMAITTVVNKTRDKLIQKGLSRAAATKIGQQAGENYAKKHKSWAKDVVDYGVPAHAVYGGMQADEVRSEVEAMDTEEFLKSSAAQERLAQLKRSYDLPDEQLIPEAKRLVAEDASNNALLNPTLISANMLFGGMQAKLLEKIARGGANKVAAVGVSTGLEAGQEAMQQLAKNQTMQTVDNTVQLDEGVTEAALTGALLGGGMSATAAGARAGVEKALNLKTPSELSERDNNISIPQAITEVDTQSSEVNQSTELPADKMQESKAFLKNMKQQVPSIKAAFNELKIPESAQSHITGMINTYAPKRLSETQSNIDETFLHNMLNGKALQRALKKVPEKQRAQTKAGIESVLRQAVTSAKPQNSVHGTNNTNSGTNNTNSGTNNDTLNSQRQSLRSKLVSRESIPIQKLSLDEQTALDAEAVDPVATNEALLRFEQSEQSLEDIANFEARIFEIAAEGDPTAARLENHRQSVLTNEQRKAQRFQQDNLTSAQLAQASINKELKQSPTEIYKAAEARRFEQAAEEQAQQIRDDDYDKALMQYQAQQAQEQRKGQIQDNLGSPSGITGKLKATEEKASSARLLRLAKKLKPKRKKLRKFLAQQKASEQVANALENALANDSAQVKEPTGVLASAFAKATQQGDNEKAQRLARIEAAKQAELEKIRNRAKRVTMRKRIDNALAQWISEDSGEWSLSEADFAQNVSSGFEYNSLPAKGNNNLSTELPKENVDNLPPQTKSLPADSQGLSKASENLPEQEVIADKSLPVGDKDLPAGKDALPTQSITEPSLGLTVEEYSEKSLVIRGDTTSYKNELDKAGFRYNRNLKGGPGWIAPKSKQAQVDQLVDKVNQVKKTSENSFDNESESTIDKLKFTIGTDMSHAAVKAAKGSGDFKSFLTDVIAARLHGAHGKEYGQHRRKVTKEQYQLGLEAYRRYINEHESHPTFEQAVERAKSAWNNKVTTVTEENTNDRIVSRGDKRSNPSIEPEQTPRNETKRRAGESASRVPRTDSTSSDSSSHGSTERTEKPSRGRTGDDNGQKGRDREADEFDNGRSYESVSVNHTLSDADLPHKNTLQRAKDNVAALTLAKQLKGRPATPKQQSILAKYAGWGASDFANKLFPTDGNREKSWQQVYDQLESAVTESELKAIQKSTQYAHYTPSGVIDFMYNMLARLGLTKGLVIEGGLGTGHFIGRHPESSKFSHVGIERDPISASIAKSLYPESSVVEADFTDVALPQNFYDAAIGNPPFANITVKDDKRYKQHGFKLHDYFIAKQIDALKPNGIGAFVTSSGTMDKKDASARQYMINQADFLGAVRLPAGAFKAQAGTDVVTDVLFFRKRAAGEPAKSPHNDAFLETELFQASTIQVNKYFSQNPSTVLGNMTTRSGRFGKEITVKPPEDLQQSMDLAMSTFPKDLVENISIEELNAKAIEFELKPKAREFEMYVAPSGQIRHIVDGVGVKMPLRATDGRGLTKSQAAIVRDYVDLKGLVKSIYRAQYAGSEGKSEQAKLHQEYDKFVKKHGPINQEKKTIRSDGKTIVQYPVLDAFVMDPEAFRVAAIETQDENGNWVKGRVFDEVVFGQQAERTISSAMDAMAVTLNEKGYLDLNYMKSLYPTESEAALLSELGNAVFVEPQSKKWLPADLYLSGNVKAKLKAAQEQAKTDPSFNKNVKALKSVQPEDIEIDKVPAKLGSFWIPKEIVTRFAEERLAFSGKIEPLINGDKSSWIVDGQSGNKEFATERRSAHALLESALNRRTEKVFDTVYIDGKEKRQINNAETAAANETVAKIKDEFKTWVIEDLAASAEIKAIYNRDFNTTVPRKYDGSHLTLPRLSSRYKLRDWQKNVAWRILQNGNTYMAHGVGAGKTLASSVAAIELKRLGLANKPTFAVLKSTLKQFAAEMLDAYPDARILVADEKKLDKRNRRQFLAQLTTEDWDAVVMTHEAFKAIPLSDNFLTAMVEREIESYQELLNELEPDERLTRKQLEQQIEKLENKIKSALDSDRKDAGITFEETGIDFVFVDEAHIKHKKIPFPTRQGDIKGVASEGSETALDLYLKTRYLNQLRPNKNLVLMSGTPVTNTLGEVFNIQRYLQPEVLERNSISSFDGWSATFADTETQLEMAADGTFKPQTRMTRFTGLPGLMRDFLQVADIVTSEDIAKSGQVKRPKVKGGQMEIISVPISEQMQEYQKELSARLDAISQRKGPPTKGMDIVPNVIFDGEMAALDMRLVGRDNEGVSKLETLISEVYKTWEEGKDKVYYGKKNLAEPKKGSTQLIFSDIQTTQHAHINVYEHIRDSLVKRGIPREEIAFIQEYKTDTKKRELFKAVNTGKVRVVLGGTSNLGTGVNVQQRLERIHRLTTPYMPSEIEQQDGRGIRQGNKNDEVQISAYVTEGTVDAFKYQLLENKDRMIKQLMKGDFTIHEVEDLGSDDGFAMAKAIASGNPLVLEQAGLQAEVKKLKALRSAHYSKRSRMQQDIQYLQSSRIPRLSSLQDQAGKIAVDEYQETAGDKFSVKVGGKSFNQRKELGAYILNAVEAQSDIGIIELGGKKVMTTQNQSTYEFSLFDKKARDALLFKGQDYAVRIYRSDVLAGNEDPSGLARKLENHVRNFDSYFDTINAAVGKANNEIEQLENGLKAKFQYENDLIEKSSRLDEVNDKIELGETPSEAKPKEESKYSLISTAPTSAMSSKKIDGIAKQFVGALKGGAGIKYTVVNKQAELPNPPATDSLVQAEYQNGHVFLVRENIGSEKELAAILREEVIAHHGLNQVLDKTSYEKLISRVVSSKSAALRTQWNEVQALYPDFNQEAQAEEVIGKLAQVERTKLGIVWTRIKNLLAAGLRRVGLLDSQRITQAEVQSILDGIARSMRKGDGPKGPNGGNNKGKTLHARSIPSKGGNSADKVIHNVSSALKNFKLSDIPKAIKSAWENNRKHALKFAPRRMITELASTMNAASSSFVESLKKYDQRVSQMEASRNELINRSQEVADSWRKLMAKDPESADKMADLMHEATLAGVDPSDETYQPAIGEQQANDMLSLINTRIKMRNGDTTFVAQQIEAKQRITAALQKEKDGSRESAYDELRAKYVLLPDGFKGFYTEREAGKTYSPTVKRKGTKVWQPGVFEQARDVFKAQNIRREQALVQRIEDLMVDDNASKALAAEIRMEFEMNEVEGIYFPLQRFGEYVGMVIDDNGDVITHSMFESYGQLKSWQKEQESTQPDDYTVLAEKRVDMSKQLDAVSPKFMNNVIEKLKGFGTRGDQMRDEIYQLYLESLPEMSARKQQMHRKGTPGFSADALRAYAHNTFHGAYNVARLENTHHMDTIIEELRFDQKAARDNDNEDSFKMSDIINELQRRHEWILNPQGSAFANTLTNIGFMWYLGATPAAALLNITQTPILALPIMGAKYGWVDASKHLAKASKEFIVGKGNAEKSLSGYEKLAFEYFLDSGVVDKTLAHDLSGLAEGGVEYSPKMHKFTEMVSFMFHHTERFNREVTALAAYRLAAEKFKKKGFTEKGAHEKAIQEATDITYQAHFDYSNANKARFMQSDTAKVLLLFRQHSLNMTWRLIRDVQQAVKGRTKKERVEARKQLAGILGMTYLFAGAVGMPLFSSVMAMLNLAFDDEDEPFNAEAELRAFATEHLGADVSALIFKGALNTLSGADVSSRTSLNNLWLRDPDPTLEGEAVVQYYAEQALGPLFGIALGFGRSAQLWREGQVDRAAEAALPKAFRDGLKAIRYHQEGVNSYRGDPILEETSLWQEFLQGTGWTPHEISEVYGQNSALKGYERQIMNRRKVLMNRYALAVRLGDKDLRLEALEDIQRFNQKNKTMTISNRQLAQSIRRRAQLSKKAESGVILNKKLQEQQDGLRYL